MPRKAPASWDRKQYRWTKMIDGHRYRVSCKQLNLPRSQWTKEGSWQAATDHFAKLEGKETDIGPEAKDKLKELQSRIAFAKSHLTPDDVKRLEGEAATVSEHHHDESQWPDDDDYLNKRLEAARLLGITIPDDVDPIGLQSFFGRSDVWSDRLSRQKEVETCFTLKHNIKEWLEVEAMGDIEHKTKLEYQTRSKDFIKLFGETYDVRAIDSATLLKLYKHYRSDACKLTGKKQQKGFRMFKRFVTYLIENNILETPPRNLTSKAFRFSKEQTAVKLHDQTEVIDIINSLPERLKLYALLALNCSMNNIDIANLSYHPTYVDTDGKRYATLAYMDFKKGRITRSRIKTRKQTNPPVVNYKLWPITLQLLSKLKSNHERWVLTTKVNTKLVGDDDETTKDQIYSQWTRKEKRINLKELRSIGLTAMAGKYRAWREVYLANKPQSVTDVNYDAGDADSQATLDEITDYIGRKFKQLGKELSSQNL